MWTHCGHAFVDWHQLSCLALALPSYLLLPKLAIQPLCFAAQLGDEVGHSLVYWIYVFLNSKPSNLIYWERKRP